MNKVIIAGKSASLNAELEARLRHHGLKAPLPSRREGLPPQAVTSSICRAHQCPDSAQDFRQITPGPVWSSLALDLLLGNQDNTPWGWADPLAIHLLDYWRELDPLALFLFVYDDAQQALQEAGAAWPDETGIRQCLGNWKACNEAMLRFFQSHPERCLLVNARRARADAAGLVALLETKLGSLPHCAYNSDAIPSQGGPGTLHEALAFTTPNPAAALATLLDDRTERFLLDQHMTGHPDCMRLFEELQAAAHLPHAASAETSASHEAWHSFVARRRVCEDIITGLCQERFLLLTQLHQTQEELERLHTTDPAREISSYQKTERLVGAAERVKQQLSYRLGSTIVRKSRGPVGWLTMPFALLGEIMAHGRGSSVRDGKPLPPIHTYEDAHEAERVKQQLSYRLGNTLVKHGRSPASWLKLPTAMRAEIKAFKQSRSNARQGQPRTQA
jgi:hypothetical protein